MAYGLNIFSQTSDTYKNKLESTNNSSTLGYRPFGYNPSFVPSYKSSFSSNYTPTYSRFDSSKMLQTIEENKSRSTIDRIFDGLSVFNYTMMGGVKNLVDDDKETTLLNGVWNGLKASNPFGDGYQKGEATAYDVLTELGWKPSGAVGGIAKFGTGLALDIFTDPTTYMTFGISGLLKGAGVAGKYANKVDDFAKTVDATSDVLKSFKTVENTSDDIIQGADKIFKRRVTPDDVRDLFKDTDILSSAMEYDDYVDLANRANKYTGITYDKKHSALAFDFFSDKSWGFRKEFVSSDKMAKLGDDLGIAPFVQSVVDEIVMHPYYSKLGKNATKHVLARTDLNGLIKGMRVEDLVKSRYSRALKLNAEIRASVRKFEGKMTEEELNAVTKNLEDAEEFLKYKQYNSVADTEEGIRIIKNIEKERDNITLSVDRLTDLYNVYKAVLYKNNPVISSLEKRQLEVIQQTYNAKNSVDFINSIKDKYKDIDEVLLKIDEISKYAEEKLISDVKDKTTKLASKINKLNNDVSTKTLEIMSDNYFKDFEQLLSVAKIEMSKTGVAKSLKLIKNDIEKLNMASNLNNQAKLINEHVESIKPMFKEADELTKIDLETAEYINKPAYEINQQIAKTIKNTNGAKIFSYDDVNKKIIQSNAQLPFGWQSSAYPKQFPIDRRKKDYKDFLKEKLKVFSTKFNKELIEVKDVNFTIKELEDSKSIMNLIYPNSIDNIIKELDTKLSGIRPTEVNSVLLSFLKKYNPPMFEYYYSLNFIRDIQSKGTLESFKELLFNTNPLKLSDEMVKFTQNYPAVNTILSYREIKLIARNTEDSIEDLINKAIAMYGDDIKYKNYNNKGALISYINRKYYSEIDKIISSDNYMNDWLIKFRSETDMETLKNTKFSKSKSNSKIESEIKGDVIKANFFKDSDNINNIVNAILYAPKQIINNIKSYDLSGVKKSYEVANKDLTKNRIELNKIKKIIFSDESKLTSLKSTIDNKIQMQLDILQSKQDIKFTNEERLNIIKDARQKYQSEINNLETIIKQNKVKQLSYEKNIEICERSIIDIRSELLEDVSAMKVAYEDAFKLYKYDELTKKRNIVDKQKVYLDKKDLGSATGISNKNKDSYFDYRNIYEINKQMEKLNPKETKQQYEDRIKEFISEMVNSIENASEKAINDLGLEKNEVSMFYKIKKGIASDDDSMAYDIYNKLKSSDIYYEVINNGKFKLTEADFATQLVKKFFSDRMIGDLTDNEVLKIETYIAKAQEDGLLTSQKDILVADKLSGLIKYIQKSKEILAKLGVDSSEINKLDLKLSDYEQHLNRIEDGSFIWDDLKSMAEKTRNNIEYSIKDMELEDLKLSQLEDRELEKITLTMNQSLMHRANDLIEMLGNNSSMKDDLIVLQHRMGNIVSSVADNKTIIEIVEDLIELKNQKDLSKIDVLSSTLNRGKDYIINELSGYNNISEYIDDSNLRVNKNVISSGENLIDSIDKKVKTLNNEVKKAKDILMNEIDNAKKLTGFSTTFNLFADDGSIDRYIEALTFKSRELDGLLETISSAQTFDEVFHNDIERFFNSKAFKNVNTVEGMRQIINNKMAIDITDKTKFKLDTKFNQYQQELSVMLSKEFDNIKDLEELNYFIKNYIPHMINPKYQYFFVNKLKDNPLSSMIGLSLDKFNKFSLSRRWNLTIDQYKGVVNLCKSGEHLYDSKYYLPLQESSMSAVLDMVWNNKMTIKTPYNTDVIVRWNEQLKQFDVVGTKNKGLFDKTVTLEDINIETGEYIKKEAKYTEQGMEKLYSNFINNRISMDEDTLKIFEEIEPLLRVIKFADTKNRNYMKTDYRREFEEGINPKILNTVLNIGSDFFKQLPEDLFEENPLKLYMNRALYNNKLLVDEESFPQIKALMCKTPIRNEEKVLSAIGENEQFVIMHRDLDAFKKENSLLSDTNINKVNFDILDGMLIYDRDKVRCNTFITLTKKQADYINSIPSMRDLIQVTEKRYVLEYNEVAQKQLNAGLEAFLHYYDKILRLWKLNVTVVSPSFHITNKFGNMFNNFMDIGMDVINPQIRKNAKNIITNQEGFFTTKNGKTYSYTELLSYAMDLKVIDDGMFGKELRDLIAKGDALNNSKLIDLISDKTKIPKEKLIDWQKWNPLNAETYFIYQKGTEIGASMENMDRLVNWLAHINNGMTFIDASEMTNKFLFDYSKGTVFEKEILKRVFPFWSFLRNNTKLQYQMLLEKPHIYRTVAKIRNEFEAQVPYEDRLDKSKIETYARDWWQTPFSRKTSSTTVDLLLNPNLPFQSLNVNVDTILGMINPLMKAPYELTTGKSIYSNKSIYSSKLEYLASQTYYGSTVSKLNSSGVDGKILKIVSALLGIKIGQYNEEKQNLLYRDSLIENRLDYKDELNK